MTDMHMCDQTVRYDREATAAIYAGLEGGPRLAFGPCRSPLMGSRPPPSRVYCEVRAYLATAKPGAATPTAFHPWASWAPDEMPAAREPHGQQLRRD
jgi:hypothetical protein